MRIEEEGNVLRNGWVENKRRERMTQVLCQHNIQVQPRSKLGRIWLFSLWFCFQTFQKIKRNTMCNFIFNIRSNILKSSSQNLLSHSNKSRSDKDKSKFCLKIRIAYTFSLTGMYMEKFIMVQGYTLIHKIKDLWN